MNKTLFAKVKDKCKDNGLSEKYLKAITEKMGGSIEDDSTDEEAIEQTANLIAEVAVESQSEATRWVEKSKKPKPAPKSKPNSDEDEDEDDNEGNGKGGKKANGESDTLVAELQKRIEALEKEKSVSNRKSVINAAFDKHKIPDFLRTRFSIADDEDADEVVTAFKQECITNGLMSEKGAGSKAASEKQIDEAADSLLESITAK